MKFSNILSTPQDSRWHGVARTYFHLFFAKNIFIIVLACLMIPEGIVFRNSWTKYGYSVNDEYSPYAPWVRINMALLPDCLFIIATLICCAVRRFHPVMALVGAIFLFGLYLCAATLNLIIVLSNEVSFDDRDAWERLCFAEIGVQLVITLLHIAMGVCACIAVHRWRKDRKGMSKGSEELELESAKN